MARVREFDPEQALESAMQLFWRKGYGETSIDDLVEATGVSRYGLYGTFGDKRGLYSAALERYGRQIGGKLQQTLRQPDASLPELLDFYEGLKRFARSELGRHGCLMCNTAAELAPHDREAGAAVVRFFDESRGWLTHVLRNAVRKGELRADLDVEASADHLATLQIGLATLVRGGVPDTVLERGLQAALDSMRP